MDLLDRYLAAVAALLPKADRTDIIDELRDVLLNRREEKEAELGRPLTREEDIALLRAFGHPIAVAARYGRQQYLVGPEIYPLYVFGLKAVLFFVVASAVIAGLVNSAIGPDQPGQAIATAIRVLWNGSIGAVGVVTIIAAVVQRQKVRLPALGDWNPQDLPKQPKIRRPSKFEHGCAIVFQLLFVLWWSHFLPLWLPYVTYIPLKAGQTLTFAFAPIWATLFWPVIALSFGAIAVHALNIVADGRGRLVSGANLLLQAAVLAVAWVALHAGHWVIATGVGIPAVALGKIDVGVNIGFKIALLVAAIVAGGTAAFEAWRLWRDRRKPS